MTLIYSAHDFRFVRLDTRSRALCSALSAEDVLYKVLLRNLQSCGNTVKDHTYKLTVRLTENAHSIFSTVSIHNVI